MEGGKSLISIICTIELKDGFVRGFFFLCSIYVVSRTVYVIGWTRQNESANTFGIISLLNTDLSCRSSSLLSSWITLTNNTSWWSHINYMAFLSGLGQVSWKERRSTHWVSTVWKGLFRTYLTQINHHATSFAAFSYYRDIRSQIGVIGVNLSRHTQSIYRYDTTLSKRH